MAKYKVKLYTVQSDHIFATPSYDGRTIFLESDSRQKVIKYIIENYKDLYGHKFRVPKKKNFSYDLTSKQGGAKIKKVAFPKYKKI